MFVKYSFSVLEEAAGTWSVQNGHNSVLFCGREASTREEPGWVGHVRGEAITQDRTVLLSHCAAEKGLWIPHTDRMLWFLPFSWKNGKSKPESSFEYLPLRKVLGLSDLAVTKHLLLAASASGPCRDVWLCTSFTSGGVLHQSQGSSFHPGSESVMAGLLFYPPTASFALFSYVYLYQSPSFYEVKKKNW